MERKETGHRWAMYALRTFTFLGLGVAQFFHPASSGAQEVLNAFNSNSGILLMCVGEDRNFSIRFNGPNEINVNGVTFPFSGSWGLVVGNENEGRSYLWGTGSYGNSSNMNFVTTPVGKLPENIVRERGIFSAPISRYQFTEGIRRGTIPTGFIPDGVPSPEGVEALNTACFIETIPEISEY